MIRDIYGRFTSSRHGEPKGLGVACYATWTVGMWWLFGWVAGVTLIFIAAIIITLSICFKRT